MAEAWLRSRPPISSGPDVTFHVPTMVQAVFPQWHVIRKRTRRPPARCCERRATTRSQPPLIPTARPNNLLATLLYLRYQSCCHAYRRTFSLPIPPGRTAPRRVLSRFSRDNGRRPFVSSRFLSSDAGCCHLLQKLRVNPIISRAGPCTSAPFSPGAAPTVSAALLRIP